MLILLPPAQSGNDTDDGMDHTAQTGESPLETPKLIFTIPKTSMIIKSILKMKSMFDNEQQAINAGYRKALR